MCTQSPCHTHTNTRTHTATVSLIKQAVVYVFTGRVWSRSVIVSMHYHQMGSDLMQNLCCEPSGGAAAQQRLVKLAAADWGGRADVGLLRAGAARINRQIFWQSVNLPSVHRVHRVHCVQQAAYLIKLFNCQGQFDTCTQKTLGFEEKREFSHLFFFFFYGPQKPTT